MIRLGKKSDHPGAISLKEHVDLSDDYLELARFWISPEQGRSYVVTSILERWRPELFGSLLVESVHTAAAAYAARGGMTEEDALQRIWSGFDAERANLGPDSIKETH